MRAGSRRRLGRALLFRPSRSRCVRQTCFVRERSADFAQTHSSGSPPRPEATLVATSVPNLTSLVPADLGPAQQSNAGWPSVPTRSTPALSSANDPTASAPSFASYPLVRHLASPRLLVGLLAHLEFADWLALFSTSSALRQLFGADALSRATVLARFLRGIGYQAWRPQWGEEPLALALDVRLASFLLSLPPPCALTAARLFVLPTGSHRVPQV